jgi:hypothetical protein
MPKISPRPEVTSHPVYQAAMAAQQVAYQLMREVPADRKADAALLHGACVHMTSYAAYALDPDASAPSASWRGVLDAARDARERVAPLAGYAADAKDTDTLLGRLDEITKAAEEALAKAA